MPSDYLLSIFQIPNNATEVRVTCLPLKDELTGVTPSLTISKAVFLKRTKKAEIAVQLTESLRSIDEADCIQISISSNDARALGMLSQVQ